MRGQKEFQSHDQNAEGCICYQLQRMVNQLKEREENFYSCCKVEEYIINGEYTEKGIFFLVTIL